MYRSRLHKGNARLHFDELRSESRFNRTINFPDYGPDELVLIFKKMVKDADMILDPEVERMLPEYFTRVYEKP
jgi:SpoVK/Ycf46/Vps4 family AAA+-type ATPase